MFCPICHSQIKKIIKTVDNIKIYECVTCQLAIIPHQKKIKSQLYSFKSYKQQESYLEKRLLLLAGVIKRFVNKGRVLDIGGGFGQFCVILSKKGNYSIDLLEPFVKPYYLKNTPINLIKKSYEKFTGKKNYDLILMMDVLEHFKEPLVILKKTRLFLNKNGYLVIQTPNYQSLMAKICKNWSWWMVTDHKYVFSLKSIKLILKKTGFKIVFLKTYEDFIDFKKNFDGNFSNRFFKILFYPFFFSFYLIFRPLLWKFGYGGAIFLIAKKYNKNHEK